MKKTLKKEKAITLIALIITIVVLLILAGIAIGVIAGDNGLIMRAGQAKKVTRYKEAKEKINIELMEIQAECTEQRKEYNIKEIALKMKEAEDITLNKTYNKEVASISEGIQINEENVEGIVISVDKYSEYKFLIGESTKIEGVLETEEIDTVAKSDFIAPEIFENNLFRTIANQSSIQFSYDVKGKTDNKVKITIYIQDKENGIEKIEFPDGGIIQCFGRTEYTKDNYEVEIGTEYKIKITSKNGYIKEETILMSDSWYNTIRIRTVEELIAFAKRVNGGKTFEKELVILENDLDLEGKEEDTTTWWTPIGTETTSFEGIFEGQNHTISNLYINKPSADNVALFGVIKNGEVHNLTVTGNVTGEGHSIAGIIGYIENGYVEKCINKANVENKATEGYRAGGVVALIKDTTIKECENYGTIKASYQQAGGIIAAITKGTTEIQIIENCKNYGSITATNISAGIVGFINSKYIIKNCYNDKNAKITTSIQYATGGILGYCGIDGEITIDGCNNDGSCESKKRWFWRNCWWKWWKLNNNKL